MSDEDAVKLLRRLVAIPSVTGAESAAVAFLTEEMRRRGLEVAIDEAGNGIAVRRGAPEAGTLMFLGHIDTVPGHVPVRIEDGALYGRGSVDAKGPLATACTAAGRARSTRATIKVVAAVGEEGPSHGARHLLRGEPPDALVIGEPGGWDAIVLGYKGSMRAQLRFEQPVSHAAGQSAPVCDVAADAWMRVRARCRDLSPGDSVFESLTPALLHMDSGTDGMAEWATMSAAFRLPPGLAAETIQDALRAEVKPGVIAFDSADEAFRAPRTSSLVGSFVRALRAEGCTPRYKVKSGTSDMNVVAPVWKCPTVAYGPGDSSLDHTPDEHIDIDGYLRAVTVLTRVFEDWSAQ